MPTQTTPAAAPPRRRVALVVVHGIGEQPAGETAEGVVEGLQTAYADTGYTFSRRPVAEADRESGRYFEMRPGEDDAGDLPEVFVYETWWARILSGPAVDGSFRIERPQQFVWFPLLNRRRVCGFAGEYSPPRIWGWTAALIVIGGILTAAYRALPTLGKALRWLRESLGATESAGGNRNPLDRLLDRRVGDIFNYVDSAGGAGGAVPDAERRILDVFVRTLRRAVDDGCHEVQVLAHSLGTVIVYRALTHRRDEIERLVSLNGETAGRPPLSRLHTIGSPLEKIRFFWPKLVATNGERHPPASLRWDNFRSPGDPVAGVIGAFDVVPQVDNHQVAGAGGLLTAHTRYRRHPTFLRVFGEALTGRTPSLRRRWGPPLRGLTTFVEGGSVLGGLLLLAVAGLVLMTVEGGLVVAFVWWLLSRLLSLVGLSGWVVSLALALPPLAAIGWALARGLVSGEQDHDEHWHGDFVLERRKTMTRSTSPETEPRPYRNPLNYAILAGNVAILAAIGWIGWWEVRYQHLSRPTAWLLILVLMTAFAVLAGRGITERWRGILIDYRYKMSLSRLQLIAWTLLVLSAVVTAVLSNVAAGAASPLSLDIPPELWVLLGISTAAAVGSPAVLSSKRGQPKDSQELEKTAEKLKKESGVAVDEDRSGVVVYNCTIDDARWGDLLKGDQAADAATVDAGKLQMFFFTFVLVLGYAAAMWTLFEGEAATIGALPPVDDSMNVLLGISQTGYLASKTVSNSKPQERAGGQGGAEAEGSAS